MTLGRKITVSAVVAVLATLIIGLVSQKIVLRGMGTSMTVDEMRSIIVSAESIRTSMAGLNEGNAFRRTELVEEYKKSGKELNQSTIYGTIPVVATWRAIEAAAKESHYEFRIPKFQARNSKNLPTPDEEAILRELEGAGVAEIVKVDSATQKLIYARPIRLTKDCLSCHGDPKTSPTGDGKDFLGFKMEGWKEGEVHGAFILKTSMKHVDAHATKSFAETLGLVVPTVIGFTLLLTLVLHFTTKKFIIKPLAGAIKTISDDSEKEVAISGEISDASTSLAQAATEQAASLEETSAALEEISSMTKRNAEHADSAQGLATDTRRAADTGSSDMQEMIKAMNEIKSASDNIAAIIKTIDEIAFQTNILALNAAVEAARAGEAGAGFAVVADEVRALAQRSATAARETAQKIEDSIHKSEHGVMVSTKVSQSLNEIVERARKMDSLVKEIAQGSKEQAQGIAQVNEAITELDKVTQSNAATAEEAASASTELKGQSEELKTAVEQLIAIIGITQAAMSRVEANTELSENQREPAAPLAPKHVELSKPDKSFKPKPSSKKHNPGNSSSTGADFFN